MPDTRPRRPGRPRGSAGDELLDIARTAFLEHGYDGTTMAAIAATARVSKSSLYREYASKEVLYAAVVTDWVDRGRDAMRPHIDALLAASDTVAALHRLARTIQAAILSPPVLQMRTLITSEAARFPGVASDYADRSWGRNIRGLAEAFAVLAERGALAADAPEVAAEQFTWLTVATPLNRITLEAGARAYSQPQLDRIADEAVATFLARFGQRPRVENDTGSG